MLEISNKKQVLISVLIGSLIPILIYGLIYFNNPSNFIDNLHGKKICQKIADELNKIETTSFYANGDTLIRSLNSSDQIKAIDSEYSNLTQMKHMCKIWVKARNSSNKPVVKIRSAFSLVDKYSAKLSNTKQYINSTIHKNETILLIFKYDDDFHDAHNVVFDYKDLLIPLQGIEYCIEQERLYQEAAEIYKYEYNDLLFCNCSPSYSIYSRKECDIFYDNKIKKNCELLRAVIPGCNNWIKEITPTWSKQSKNTSNSFLVIGDVIQKKKTIKKAKVDKNKPCKVYTDCQNDTQRTTFCKCREYQQAKKDTILAPQPIECKLFCQKIADKL